MTQTLTQEMQTTYFLSYHLLNCCSSLEDVKFFNSSLLLFEALEEGVVYACILEYAGDEQGRGPETVFRLCE